MARFCSIHVLAVVLGTFVLLSPAVASDSFTTQFGKRNIPVDLIRRALRPHVSHVENIDLSHVVYEIIDGNYLVGYDTKLNLKDDTAPRPLGPSTSLRYSVNGNERLLTPSATVRHGKGFTIIHRASDGRVAHIFGNGLSLKPLDEVYPDVFVNTLAKYPSGEHATDAVKMANTLAIRDDIVPMTQNSIVRQSGSCASGTVHHLELAVAFDNQFCAMFADDESIATAAVQTLVNQADEIFQEFTCVSISLVHIEAHCNDPADPYTVLSDFSRAGPGEVPSTYIQRGFGDFWELSRTGVRRDAAYFLSGFDDGSSTAGRAGLGAACNSFAYGWSEKLNLAVFVHEVGHLVGSDHTATGIMVGSGHDGGPIFFSQDSINAITGFVDSVTDDCLSVSAPMCDATCPGPCVNGQCIARYSSDASPGIVPCSAIGGSFRCVNTEQIFSSEYSYATDCPESFNYVAREASEANEPDTFCCMAPTDSLSSSVAPGSYRFIHFTLNLPDGPRIFPEYIQDPSVIETRTLLQTQLVPSCSTGSSAGQTISNSSPDPVVVTTPTPVPIIDTEIPEPTAIVDEPIVPVETAAPSDPEESSGPEYDDGTCGAALSDSETISCESFFAEQIEVPFRDGQPVRVMVRLLQRKGKFVAVLRARMGFKIRRVAAKLTTDGSLGPNDVGPPTLYEDQPERVLIEEDAFEMSLPSGAPTCCGEDLHLYAQVEVCLEEECVISGVYGRKTEILCSEPCASSPGGTVVPFSAEKFCPSCRE